MGRNGYDETEIKIRRRAKAIYGEIDKEHAKKPKPTRGPRMIFYQDYLKNAKTPEEIKSAVERFIKDHKEYGVETVMTWAKEIFEYRQSTKGGDR